MTLYVVDASVAVKWYVPEVHSEKAAILLNSNHKLIAPDLLLPEFGNILWKKVQRGEIPVETSRVIKEEFTVLMLEIYPSQVLLDNAFELAIALQRTVYDCFYLALAVQQKCQMVTADEKFYNALRNTTYINNLLWVESL